MTLQSAYLPDCQNSHTNSVKVRCTHTCYEVNIRTCTCEIKDIYTVLYIFDDFHSMLLIAAPFACPLANQIFWGGGGGGIPGFQHHSMIHWTSAIKQNQNNHFIIKTEIISKKGLLKSQYHNTFKKYTSNKS